MQASDLSAIQSQVLQDGFAIVPNVLDMPTVERLRVLIEAAREKTTEASVGNSKDTYGLRNLTDVVPEAADLMRNENLTRVVRAILERNPFMVRATLFDKTPDANWGVFWHQDLSIAVQAKHKLHGYSPWTKKAGVHCVQPPIEIMQQLSLIHI